MVECLPFHLFLKIGLIPILWCRHGKSWENRMARWPFNTLCLSLKLYIFIKECITYTSSIKGYTFLLTFIRTSWLLLEQVNKIIHKPKQAFLLDYLGSFEKYNSNPTFLLVPFLKIKTYISLWGSMLFGLGYSPQLIVGSKRLLWYKRLGASCRPDGLAGDCRISYSPLSPAWRHTEITSLKSDGGATQSSH